MIFGSICSGIEAASQAWLRLGFECAFMSEIEPSARAVLTHHYGDTPLHGDFTTIKAGEYAGIDILVGGTPCQSFSVAGLRGGMADARGNLALEFLRLAERLRPRWVLWENVPGVLSSEGGRDFGSFVGGLAECGYGWAYRVLDAQYFGLAQRRKRVFVVGYLGDWRRAAAVLFEPASLRGNPAPSRETRERVAPTTAARVNGGGLGTDFDCDGGLITNAFSLDMENLGDGGNIGYRSADEATITLNTNGNIGVAHPLRADGFDASEDGTGRGTPLVSVETLQPNRYTSGHASTQERHANSLLSALRQAIGEETFAEWRSGILDSFQPAEILRPAVHGGSVRCEADEGGCEMDDRTLSCAERNSAGSMRDVRQAGRERRSPSGRGLSEQLARELNTALSELSHEGASTEAFLHGLRRGGEGPGILQPPLPSIQGRSAVRRLTPMECEKLQGFPDDYTLIPYRGKLMADGPRYRLLGNSMAVPVIRWIGARIERQDA